jgi:RND superfamily putative drug exporter
VAGRIGKWIALTVWLAALVAAGPLAAKLTGAQRNDASALLPRGAETTSQIQRAKVAFPGSDAPVADLNPARQQVLEQQVPVLDRSAA